MTLTDDCREIIKRTLIDEPQLIQGNGHRRYNYELPPFCIKGKSGCLLYFEPAIPRGFQSDQEDQQYKGKYWIWLKKDWKRIDVGYLQRKPKRVLVFTDKLYQMDEMSFVNALVTATTEIAPDTRIEYEYSKPHKKVVGVVEDGGSIRETASTNATTEPEEVEGGEYD